MRFLLLLLFLSFCACERGTRQWDKEIDLEDYGFLLQLKYHEPLDPTGGGKVHLKLGLLDLDLGYSDLSRRDLVNGFFRGHVNYTYSSYPTYPTGYFDCETRVEKGVWKLLASGSPLPKPLIERLVFELGLEKTTDPRSIIDGRTLMNLELTAQALGQNVVFEVIFDGAKTTLRFSRDQSSIKKKWRFEVTRPREHQSLEEPDPTYNVTVEVQDNTGQSNGVKITGELKDLSFGIFHLTSQIGLNPYGLLGLHPQDLASGPWTMLAELSTRETSNTTYLSQFSAKLANSEDKEIRLLELQWSTTNPPYFNPARLVSLGYDWFWFRFDPFFLDVDFTLGKGDQQHFNKLNLLLDIWDSANRTMKLSLRNENKPEIRELSYKLHYDFDRIEVDGTDWWDLKYIWLMQSGCASCPNRTIEKLVGNYSWTDENNREKFEFRSEDVFYSEAEVLENRGSGFPVFWLASKLDDRLRGFYEPVAWPDIYSQFVLDLQETMPFESSFPLFQLARLIGVEADYRTTQPIIHLSLRREVVYEKKKADRILNYFGNSLETAGTLKKVEHVVMMHGAMWHRVCYQAAEKGQKHLVWESVPQQTDSPTHTLNGGPIAPHSKVELNYRMTSGQGKSLEAILAHAGGFIFSYKNSMADGSQEDILQSFDATIDFLDYSKSQGLKLLVDLKLNSDRTRGLTSVFGYSGSFAWIKDTEVLQKVFAFETMETIRQTEENPFYGLLGKLGFDVGNVTNVTRLFRYDKTYNTGTVIRNGAEVVAKIKKKNLDLRPSHVAFDIALRLPIQNLCIPHNFCLGRDIEVEIHVPNEDFFNSVVEIKTNITGEVETGNRLATSTNVTMWWDGLGNSTFYLPVRYRITNELLFEEGNRTFDRIIVDGEGDISLPLDWNQQFSWEYLISVIHAFWAGSCRGSSENSCRDFGIPEASNFSVLFYPAATTWRYHQHSKILLLWRFQNEPDPLGFELDVNKVGVYDGPWLLPVKWYFYRYVF